MVGIGGCGAEEIAKHGGGLIKGDPMLAEILGRFGRIPFKLHALQCSGFGLSQGPDGSAIRLHLGLAAARIYSIPKRVLRRSTVWSHFGERGRATEFWFPKNPFS